jgi:hypothetical protein
LSVFDNVVGLLGLGDDSNGSDQEVGDRLLDVLGKLDLYGGSEDVQRIGSEVTLTVRGSDLDLASKVVTAGGDIKHVDVEVSKLLGQERSLLDSPDRQLLYFWHFHEVTYHHAQSPLGFFSGPSSSSSQSLALTRTKRGLSQFFLVNSVISVKSRKRFSSEPPYLSVRLLVRGERNSARQPLI